MDVETITLILNIAFWAIAGLVLLGGIFGLGKRVGRALYYLIWNSVIIALGALLTGTITKALGGLDISFLGSIPVGGSNIACTTVFETLEKAILAFGGNDEEQIVYMLLHEPETMEAIKGLVTVLLSYVVFILWMVLTLTVFKLLGMLFYHTIFKRFVERGKWQRDEDGKIMKDAKGHKLKKKRKFLGRLGSAGISLVRAGLTAIMVLSPLTALVNTVDKAVLSASDENKQKLSEGQYSSLMDYIDAYNNSAFGQTFITFSDNGEGNSFDMTLMNFITATDINGDKLYFCDEIGSILEIGIGVLSSGLLDNNMALTTALANKDAIDAIFDAIAGSNLLTNIISIAANVAVNYMEVKDIIIPLQMLI